MFALTGLRHEVQMLLPDSQDRLKSIKPPPQKTYLGQFWIDLAILTYFLRGGHVDVESGGMLTRGLKVINEDERYLKKRASPLRCIQFLYRESEVSCT